MSKDLAVAIDEKWYAGKRESFQVLAACHFEVKTGELLVLLGESGCGKSTLLRLLLSLDREYVGSIQSGGTPISRRHPKRGIVFQDPRLLPWMTTLQNVQFAMHGEDTGDERVKRAQIVLKLVGLEGFESRWPRELSGGMAQRTALARALVNMPDILLLDEPFAALDLHTRFRLQYELLSVLKKTGTTTVLVTHDIDEALYLADRVIVMTQRPGAVKSTHEILMAKPRERAADELLKLRKVLLEQLVSD